MTNTSNVSPIIQLIQTSLFIPPQCIHSLVPSSNTIHAYLNCNWLSHIVSKQRYYRPPDCCYTCSEILTFLSPSITSPQSEGWNCFIITCLVKPLDNNRTPSPINVNATEESSIQTLVHIKNNIKLHDRGFLRDLYSINLAHKTNNDKSPNYIDTSLLEEYFGCQVIAVKAEDLNSFCPDDQVSMPQYLFCQIESCHHILPTYCIFETSDAFYIIQPQYKITLYEAIKFSPRLISESVSKLLFLLFQLKSSIGNILNQDFDSEHLSLANFYIDKNLWLYSLGVMPSNVHVVTTMVQRNNASYVLYKAPNATYNLQYYTVQWQNGELSNYMYLMHVNHFAGRRLGDPNNSPILPWVSDFKSPNGNWRDLSKTKYRLSKGNAQLDFIYNSYFDYTHLDNFNTILEPHHVTDTFSEITYYIYNARKTTKTILCKYVRPRWEPSEYPKSILRIQEWTPDECIPEFFTDPYIFRSIHEDLEDLEVPGWCTSPESFISWHSQVLESQHVSDNIHKWIDLHFGYKLVGEAAYKAKNIPLFLVRKQTVPCNFGIHQLFKEPHPKRCSSQIKLYYQSHDFQYSKSNKKFKKQDSSQYSRKDSLISTSLSKVDLSAYRTLSACCTLQSISCSSKFDECTIDDEYFGTEDIGGIQNNVCTAYQKMFTLDAPSHEDTSIKRRFQEFDSNNPLASISNIFKSKHELDEATMIKPRSIIRLPRNINFTKLLDSFDNDNLFYANSCISTSIDPKIESRSNIKYPTQLLFHSSTLPVFKQLVLVTLSTELLCYPLLSSYPLTAPLTDKLPLLVRSLKDVKLVDYINARPMITLVKKYLNEECISNEDIDYEFPIKFPSYFEQLHLLLCKINAFKSCITSHYHLNNTKQHFRASDYSILLHFFQNETIPILNILPYEGLCIFVDHCKWIFLDPLLGPLALLECFSGVAHYIPINYLHTHFTPVILNSYTNLSQHQLYPFLFQRTFILSLIKYFGAESLINYFLRHIIKVIMLPTCLSRNVINHINDILGEIHYQHISIYHNSDRNKLKKCKPNKNLLSQSVLEVASSIIASDSLCWLSNYLGITLSTNYILKELFIHLPDYAAKVISCIDTYTNHNNIVLYDTCFVTIYRILKPHNHRYIDLICNSYISKWLKQTQGKSITPRAESTLAAIIILAKVKIYASEISSIQHLAPHFIKEIFEPIFDVVSSSTLLFTRGAEFRNRILISLLHLITDIVYKIYNENCIYQIKPTILKIFGRFSTFRTQRISSTNITYNTNTINSITTATATTITGTVATLDHDNDNKNNNKNNVNNNNNNINNNNNNNNNNIDKGINAYDNSIIMKQNKEPSNVNKVFTQLEFTFSEELLSNFAVSISNFLKLCDIENTIAENSIVCDYMKSDISILESKLETFNYRPEFEKLLNSFYPGLVLSTSGLPLQEVNYGKPSWFAPNDTFVNSFSLEENEQNFESKFTDTIHNSNYKHISRTVITSPNNWISYFNRFYLHNIEDRTPFIHLQTLSGSETISSKFCNSPSENMLFSGARENVSIWRLHDSQKDFISPVQVYKSHSRQIKCLQYAHGSDNIVSSDGAIHVWNAETMYCSFKNTIPNKMHLLHCLSPRTPNVIYSATSENSLYILDSRAARMANEWALPPTTLNNVFYLCTYPDDSILTLAHLNGFITTIDTRTGFILGNWPSTDSDVSSVCFHKNNIFLCGLDSSIKIFSAQGSLLQHAHTRFNIDFTYGISETQLLTANYSEGSIILYEKQEEWSPIEKFIFPKTPSPIVKLHYAPLHQFLFASLEDCTILTYGTCFLSSTY